MVKCLRVIDAVAQENQENIPKRCLLYDNKGDKRIKWSFCIVLRPEIIELEGCRIKYVLWLRIWHAL